MAHIFQVGAGSGGMVVLDLLARDPRVSRITVVEPDVFATHNVHRHHFPHSAVGQMKADLAKQWLLERRPELEVETCVADLTDPAWQTRFAECACACDIGVCAVDNEPAKYAFDALLRAASKPWTLGEVLSGGIGGWVHQFVPGGPCYGCVASYLQRTVTEEVTAPAPDYANPGDAVPETTIPASKASIEAIAALHAVVTLELMDTSPADSMSLLMTLKQVPGVFDEPYRTFRFRVPRRLDCLICSATANPPVGEDLDEAVDHALGRLVP